MTEGRYKVGMIVAHPNKPEWGRGEIVNTTETSVHIFFRDHPAKKTRIYNRIFPNGPIGWDSSDLDYVRVKPEIEADVQYFAKPDKKKVFPVKKLRKKRKRKLVPSSSGVYGWYFDELPPYVPKSSCTPIKECWLLYIGKADNLQERIVDFHIRGKTYGQGTISTLRLSLGCLLSNKYRFVLCIDPESGQSFGGKEKKLNNWLDKHAKVVWIETEKIDAVERQAIKRYILPLNLKHNDHPLVRPLSKLRSAFKTIANNPAGKAKNKDFRKAYKEFVKQCKDKEYVRRCKELGGKK